MQSDAPCGTHIQTPPTVRKLDPIPARISFCQKTHKTGMKPSLKASGQRFQSNAFQALLCLSCCRLSLERDETRQPKAIDLNSFGRLVCKLTDASDRLSSRGTPPRSLPRGL
jgi:hypothetical protein